jgi:hypothetical protein
VPPAFQHTGAAPALITSLTALFAGFRQIRQQTRADGPLLGTLGANRVHDTLLRTGWVFGYGLRLSAGDMAMHASSGDPAFAPAPLLAEHAAAGTPFRG